MFDRLKGPNPAGRAANVIGRDRCEAELRGKNLKDRIEPEAVTQAAPQRSIACRYCVGTARTP